MSMKLKQCLEVIESHVALSNGLFNFGIHEALRTVILLMFPDSCCQIVSVINPVIVDVPKHEHEHNH